MEASFRDISFEITNEHGLTSKDIIILKINSIYNYKNIRYNFIIHIVKYCKAKGKSVPFQARSGPKGSRKLRFPDFVTTQDGSKVVSLTHLPPLPPGNIPGTHFC